MKVILSRKGFDSEYGGFPSPILPSGEMISLPIPSPEDHFNYKDLKFNNKIYYDMMKELGIKESVLETPCHIDPDIYPNIINRKDHWTHLFGQRGAAQGHLSNQEVKEGDLFLFFGTFRKTILDNNKLRFNPKEKGEHMIFGYLQIGKIIRAKEELEDWMKYHPHCDYDKEWSKNNALYVASKKFSLNPNIPGAGFFNYDKNLVLSAKDQLKKSLWDIPILRGKNISYHTENSWQGNLFKSAAKGQEFVIKDDSEIEKWAKELIIKNRCSK